MATAIQVAFYGATITTIQNGNELFVAMKPIVENIGLDWKSQYARIKRHPVLNSCVVMMTIQADGDTQGREHMLVPLKMLNGWLFGIDSNRVKASLRDKVIAYQSECFDVLARHFGLAQPAIQTLSPAQKRDLQNAVSARAYAMGGSREDFASVYRVLKDHFKVASYTEIPASKFTEALELIETATHAPIADDMDKVRYIVQQAQALAKHVQAYYGIVDVKTYTIAQDITFRTAFAPTQYKLAA